MEEIKKYTEEEEQLMNEIFENQIKEDNDYKNKYLYALAEIENIKKRTAQEKNELMFNVKKNVVNQVISVVDDYERALKSNKDIDDAEQLKEAFKLMYKKFISLLNYVKVEQIQVKEGDEFDTKFCEAVASVPGDEDKKNTICGIVQPGYMMDDKVIRYTKVAVVS